jgi:hypothetical protein
MTPKPESGTATRLAREILTAVSGDDILRKLSPSAIDLIEQKIASLEERLDDANLLLRAMLAMQVVTIGLVLIVST